MLTSELPFWTMRNGLILCYPPLATDLTCECVVLGAGITGALLADRLMRKGFEVVVVDARDTSDRRLIVGGEVENFHSPAKRDASIQRKTKVIEINYVF